jgi:hypothetical protein
LIVALGVVLTALYMVRMWKIVFLGTPEFAVSSLDILIQNGYDVCGVVTAPDKPAGRGQQLQQSADSFQPPQLV